MHQREAERELLTAIREALRSKADGGSYKPEELAKVLITEKMEQAHNLRRALNDYTMALAIKERFGVDG